MIGSGAQTQRRSVATSKGLWGVSRLVLRPVVTAALVVVMVAQAVPAQAFPFPMAIHVSEPCGVAGQQATGSMVIDYARGFKSSLPRRLRKAGVGIVVRYVGSAKWKCLTRKEARALRRANIDIVAVYETDAKWMLKGYRAGVLAARKARAAVRACGGPRYPFVYFACDTATRKYGTVNSCLRGAASVLGADHVGIYGSYYVCAHALKAGRAAKAWQTEAWSHGHVLPEAVLYQSAHRYNGSLGIGYDSNHMRADDIGQWGYKPGVAASWAVQATTAASRLNGVDFTDGNSGWAVGAGGTVIHTSNGGSTWSSQSTGTTTTLNAVSFSDPRTGWAVGSGGTVLHTGDGGASWVAQSSGTTATLNAVRFAGANSGWAVGAGGTILHTTNGGATWDTQSSDTTATLNSVHFVDGCESLLWACGENGTLLRSQTGGSAWGLHSTPTTQTLNAVEFANTGVGWAVGDGGTILKTRDRGSTWTPQTASTNATLTSAAFADTATGWTVGEGGLVLRTTNGGSSWSRQSTSVSTRLNAVECVDRNTAWAVGDGGTVMHVASGKVDSFGTVSGLVRSTTSGARLPGVTVQIGSRPPIKTAIDGSFVAARVAPGTYTVKVWHSRYRTHYERGVVVVSKVRTAVNMRIRPKTRTAVYNARCAVRRPRRGVRTTFRATLSPASAYPSSATKMYFFHHERKRIRKRIHGRVRTVRVWYWRYRFKRPMYASGSPTNTLYARATLSKGKWHIFAKCRGSARYLPSRSAIRSVWVR